MGHPELTLQSDEAAKAAGFAALGALATSELASVDDLKLLAALTANAGLNELEGHYREDVDETDFFEDDEEADNEASPRSPARRNHMTTSSKRVAIKPYLVQAAKLRKSVNDRLGEPTSPVPEKIAALGAAHHNGRVHLAANGHVSSDLSHS